MLAVTLLACTGHALAAERAAGWIQEASAQNKLLAQYSRTTWTVKDGAPKIVSSIAQTSDGWLWFAGLDGLRRFDGIRFRHVDLEPAGSTRSQRVNALFATKEGQLLVGGYYDGITLLEGGHVRRFHDGELADSGISAFAQGQDGTLWAASVRHGLLRFDGNSWKGIPSDWDAPKERINAMLLDRRGNLWVVTNKGVSSLAAGARRFEQSNLRVGEFQELAEAPDGRAWLADPAEAVLLPGQEASAPRDPWANSRASLNFLFDREKHPWSVMSTLGSGTSQTSAILEDRAGSLWFGSTGGEVYRLRRKTFAPVPAPKASCGNSAFVGDDSGVVWIANYCSDVSVDSTDGLWRFDGAPRRMPFAKSATAITRSASGVVWVGAKDGIWHEVDKGFVATPPLPDAQRGKYVGGIAVGPDGIPWVALHGAGLFEFSGGRWHLNGDLVGLPSAEPTAMAFDLRGRLWLGYGSGNLMMIEGKHVSTVATAEALRLGPVMALSVERHVLVAGERGLGLQRGDHFVPLRTSRADILASVAGIVEPGSGDVWLNGAHGAVRMESHQLDNAVVDGALDVLTESFDESDGYPGTGSPDGWMRPNLSAMPDGMIWLAGNKDSARFDPNQVARDDARPPAFIEALRAEGRTIAVPTGVKLPKGTRNLQIEYTALDYAHPERLRFKYRLAGYEGAWIDVGERREAFYTNLGPGSYRFEVQAANESGLWSEHPAAIDFEIPPTFAQSRPFFAMCALFGAFLLAFLYRMSRRQFTLRERARLQGRLGERERIARELHDTLLQSTQGLILSFGSHAKEIADGHPARIELEQTLQLAKEVMREGRDRVQDLRLVEDATDDLLAAIARIGEQLAVGNAASFRAVPEGDPRELLPLANKEAYQIMREALLNSFRHARASSIEVRVAYEATGLRASVRDDGIGLDDEIARAGAVTGHWGLKGMHERALGLGGSLDIRSRPDGGTVVELEVPARLAYPSSRRWMGRIFRRNS